MPKATLNKTLFHLQIGLTFKEETTEMLHVEYSFVWFWTLQLIKNTSEVLRCRVGEGWSLVGLIVWEMKKYCTGSRAKGIFYILQNVTWICHILHRNWLLKQLLKGRQMEGLKETRRHWWLDGTLWRSLFGRICGPVVKDRLCKEWKNWHTPNTAQTKSAKNSNEAVWCACSKRGDNRHLREKAESNRLHFTQCENMLKASNGWEDFIQTELPDTSPTKSLVRLTWQNRRICTKYKPAWLQASAAKQMRNAFWAITQRVVVIPFRRFRTTYRSHLQGSRIPPLPPPPNSNFSMGFI
jgi:hypothetical protein